MRNLRRQVMRRDMLRRAVAATSAGALIGLRSSFAPAQAQSRQKLAKADAHYQDQPNGTQHCADCAFYIPPVACQLVRGEVSPNGWCQRFQPRAG
jgi:uncharacterized membrane protein